MSDHVESMAYANEIPWHRNGTQVDEGISADEMAIAAGLTWGVELRKVYYGPTKRVIKGRMALVRDDTLDVLDIVGSRWNPVQNIEVLRFFQEFVDAGDMHIETAGSLHGGKMVWALAKLGADFTLPGGDVSQGYILLANPHQYGKALVAKLVAERVVCHNTMSVALRETGAEFRMSHNRKFDDEAQEAARARIGLAREKFDAFAEVAASLARLTITTEDATRIAAELLKSPDPMAELAEQPRTVQTIVAMYEGEAVGSELASARGTAWGLLNAVTEYTDHRYGHNDDNRLAYSWFGRGEALKRRASDMLLALND